MGCRRINYYLGREMFAYLIYGQGNPFSTLSALGLTRQADVLAARLCDAPAGRLVLVPSWLREAADYYMYGRGFRSNCLRCFNVLWQPHQHAGFHDSCYQDDLADEALDALIVNDLADDVLFHLEMDRFMAEVDDSTLAQAERAAMSDASFQQWLDDTHPVLSPDVRALAIEKFRAGELRG